MDIVDPAAQGDQRDDDTGASLSTHVLDAGAGGPRPGVRVDVFDREGAPVAAGVSDERGRIEALASGLVPGPYLITWQTGGAFVAQISVTVHLRAGLHHHIPLLSTGASAMVYLGA